MSSIDDFHKLVGVIFSRLSETFPLPRDLEPALVPAGLIDPGREGQAGDELFQNALRWLRSEKFISYAPEQAALFPAARLTDKGTEALSRSPEGLPGTVGAALIAAVRAGADAELVKLVKLAYGAHMREVLGKIVLGVLFDQWSCNHYPEGGAPLLVHLGCDSGCRC